MWLAGCCDASLVDQGVLGDPDALEELYRRYSSMVGKIVRDEVRDPHARPDIHQSVFERALSSIASLHDGASFRPWIAQIARRVIIDHYRARSRFVETNFDDVAGRDLPSNDPSPTQWAEMHGLVQQLGAALEMMSPRDAQAVVLSANRNMSCDEIAQHLGIKGSNARVVIHRARKRLRAELHEPLRVGEALPA